MVVMKGGDDDLVEDEASILMNTSMKKPNPKEVKEDFTINESTAEQKVTGSIPMLTNNKNALIRNNKPFSQRLKSGELNIDIGDIHQVSNYMIFEINLLAGKTLVLRHKLVEVMRLAPRFISDYLCLEYREKIRNQLNDSIFRNVIETGDFALPSEENIGEEHRLFANTKRATKYANSNYGIRIYDLNNEYVANKQQENQQNQATEEQNTHKAEVQQRARLAHEHEVTPILFEECYVKNGDFRFV